MGGPETTGANGIAGGALTFAPGGGAGVLDFGGAGIVEAEAGAVVGLTGIIFAAGEQRVSAGAAAGVILNSGTPPIGSPE